MPCIALCRPACLSRLPSRPSPGTQFGTFPRCHGSRLQAKFAELDDESRQLLDQEARASRGVARAAREIHRRQGAEAQPDVASLPVADDAGPGQGGRAEPLPLADVVASATDPAAFVPEASSPFPQPMRAANCFACNEAVDTLASEDASFTSALEKAHTSCTSASASPEPLGVEFMQRYFGSDRLSIGEPFYKCHERFKKKQSVMCAGTDFPESVTYPTHCGCLCVKETPREVVALLLGELGACW